MKMIYSDFKPANLIMAIETEVLMKLVDFGFTENFNFDVFSSKSKRL